LLVLISFATVPNRQCIAITSDQACSAVQKAGSLRCVLLSWPVARASVYVCLFTQCPAALVSLSLAHRMTFCAVTQNASYRILPEAETATFSSLACAAARSVHKWMVSAYKNDSDQTASTAIGVSLLLTASAIAFRTSAFAAWSRVTPPPTRTLAYHGRSSVSCMPSAGRSRSHPKGR
jgi:hypothetical protein